MKNDQLDFHGAERLDIDGIAHGRILLRLTFNLNTIWTGKIIALLQHVPGITKVEVVR